MKEVPAVSRGICATSHLPSSAAPPSSRRMPMCHGPDTKAPTSPLMKLEPTASGASCADASPCVKNEA